MKEKEFCEIPNKEYIKRNNKRKALMAKYGIDALLIFCRENVNYYCGWRDTWDFSFLHGAILPSKGEPAMIVPVILNYGIEKHTYVKDVTTYEEANPAVNPVEVVIKRLKDMDLADKTIGLELGIGMFPTGATALEIEAIRKNLPKATFVDAAPMLWEQRSVKTPWEIELYRDLCQAVIRGYLHGAESCRAGMTERDVQTAIWKSFIDDGLADSPMRGGIIMRSHSRNIRTPAFTGRATNHVLKKGDMLMLDGGPTLNGYFTDIQRQFCIGKPSDLVKQLHDLAMVGFQALETILKPGIPTKECFLAPARAMTAHRPDLSFPWRFMGHSIGLQIHEFPWLIREEERRLEPGMIFCVEIPGYDIPQWREMGSFVEDMYLITKSGFENLTQDLARQIFVC
jgi:Xaa-Pro aminopeptidase